MWLEKSERRGRLRQKKRHEGTVGHVFTRGPRGPYSPLDGLVKALTEQCKERQGIDF